jgi:MerR family transcriptional regulator/heat shock protein HspR
MGNAATPNMELEGVYIISVAARLLEMHPQTLRKYERLGLIQPVRTMGMLRLYSQDDLRKVMLIRHLMDNLGLNLAGVEFALKLVNNLSVFSRRLARTTDDAAVMANIREEVARLCGSLSLPAPE